MSNNEKASSAGSVRSRSTSLSSSSSESRASRPQYRSQSRTGSRSRSRSIRSTPHGEKILYSGRHLDDQSVYHSDGHTHCDSDLSDSDLSSLNGAVLEVRGGIVNERDVDLEAGAQQPTAELEKSRTGRSDRSRQDPTLVRRIHSFFRRSVC